MVQQWYDILIVGGGIVGLATARDFLKRRPGLRDFTIAGPDGVGLRFASRL